MFSNIKSDEEKLTSRRKEKLFFLIVQANFEDLCTISLKHGINEYKALKLISRFDIFL